MCFAVYSVCCGVWLSCVLRVFLFVCVCFFVVFNVFWCVLVRIQWIVVRFVVYSEC